MHEILFYKENGVTKVKVAYIDKNGNKKYETRSYFSCIKIINEAEKSSDINKLITGLNFSGDSLSFRLDGVKIVLNNYDDFRYNKDFAFIFKYMKDKNYKINRVKRIILYTAIGGAITCSVVLLKNGIKHDIDIDSIESSTSSSVENIEESTKKETTTSDFDENLFGTAVKEETTKEESTKKETTTSVTTTKPAETTIKETTVPQVTTTTTLPAISEEETTKALVEVTKQNDEELKDDKEVKAKDDNSIIRIAGDSPYHNENSNQETIYINDIVVKEPSSDDMKIVADIKQNYGSIIQKYCSMYKVDYEIMCAVAAQESGGKHSSSNSGSAIGLMQIEKGAYGSNEYISVHNYLYGTDEKVYPKKLNLGNVDSNIKVACALMQRNLKYYNGNYLIALQAYNKGMGAMDGYLLNYANEIYGPFKKLTDEDKKYYIDKISSNYDDRGWIDFVTGKSGDNKYVAHVLKFYEGDMFVVEKSKTL